MAIRFRFYRLLPASLVLQKPSKAIGPVLLAILACFGCAVGSSARSAKDFQPATLVETGEYNPCGEGCALVIVPKSAFCFRLGNQSIVGEGSSYLHEKKVSGLEDLSGNQVSIRMNQHSIWLRPTDGPTVKIKRGTLYENFKDAGCVAEVHKPILARAESSRRPMRVPSDAIAIPGSGRGVYQPLFLWYRCSMDSASATIGCQRWYLNGDSDGTDWYCTHTIDGIPVAANFTIDPTLSQDGRLVLNSGAVLQHDNRGRTNGELDRPGEACR
jgi:hypothetical protein